MHPILKYLVTIKYSIFLNVPTKGKRKT